MAEYLSPGVYVEEIEIGAKPIEGVGTSTAGFVGITEKVEDVSINEAVFISSWGEYIKKFGRYTENACYLAPAVYGFFLNGGQRCYVVSVGTDADGSAADDVDDSSYIGTDGDPGSRTGLQVFKEIDKISLVSIPGILSPLVQDALISHCTNMEDRFCILDSIRSADVTVVQTKNGLTSDKGFGAIYYPWIKVGVEQEVANPNVPGEMKIQLNQLFMPPSGYMAGIFARSDNERGVHKAPANEKVRGVIELEFPIGKGEQDILNPDGVNCIRSFPGRGIRVWGARTISSDPLWKYINVRRLFLYLEESIDEATQWVVFEPNSEILWARVIQTISNFLKGVWKSGALMGLTPEEAFFVKCDRTTMTQDDIDNGRLIVMIGVAPVKPAEFVIFRIAQWTNNSE